MINPNLKK